MQTLLDACFEEIFELSETDITGNPWKFHNILEQRRVAFSLCGAPHLASIQQLDNKFLRAYTKVVPP